MGITAYLIAALLGLTVMLVLAGFGKDHGWSGPMALFTSFLAIGVYGFGDQI